MRGSGAFKQSANLVDLFLDLFFGAVRFDDQNGLRIDWIAGVDVRLNRLGDRLVHDLHSARDNASRDYVGDGLSRLLDLVERRQNHARFDRHWQQPDRNLGGDTQQSFRARDEGKQVVAGGIQRVPANLE